MIGTGSAVLDPSVLRRAFSCFPSGVTAVCGLVGDEPAGMAASSFTSVSLDPRLRVTGGVRLTAPRSLIRRGRATICDGVPVFPLSSSSDCSHSSRYDWLRGVIRTRRGVVDRDRFGSPFFSRSASLRNVLVGSMTSPPDVDGQAIEADQHQRATAPDDRNQTLITGRDHRGLV